jgi:hypothetical protein
MKIWRSMINALRAMRGCSDQAERRQFVPRELPREDKRKAEEVAKSFEEARKANARVAMGAIVTASRAMANESGVQARLRGMLSEVDKGRGHDGRA